MQLKTAESLKEEIKMAFRQKINKTALIALLNEYWTVSHVTQSPNALQNAPQGLDVPENNGEDIIKVAEQIFNSPIAPPVATPQNAVLDLPF